VRIGQAERGRAQCGQRPIGTATCGGKGFKERTWVSGERPIGRQFQTTTHPGVMPTPPPPRASLIVSHQKTPSMTTVGRSNGPHKTEYLVPHVLRPVYPCFCGLDPSPIPSLPHRDLPSLRHGLWDACKCRSRVSDGRDTLSSCTLELTRNPCLKIFRRQISVFVSPKQQKHRRQKTKTAPNPLLPVPARQQCK